MRLPLPIRRLLRPLLPDRWMARRRLHEHSAGVRHNVDIVVPPGRPARRWLDTTPDTYRVRDPATLGPGPELVRAGEPDGDQARLVGGDELDAAATAALAAPLSDPDVAAAVVAEIPPPRLVERRRVEPTPAPAAIAVRGAAWREIGGAPAGPHPLPGLLARLRDAGHRVALLPVPPAASPLARDDPITGPAAVVCSLVPLHDVGGGSRTAQLARGLLRRGFHVTFVAVQPSTGEDLGLRFVHPRLEQAALADFDAVGYLARRRDGETLAVAGVPAGGVRERLAPLGAAGAELVYDCLDDWSSPWLGGDWFLAAHEQALVGAATAVTAAAPALVTRLAEQYDVAAVLLPNGVDTRLFDGEPTDPPGDFPPGAGPVLGCHGSFAGEWIDWAALGRLAAAHPDARLVLIGDAPDPPPLPGNVHLLGPKPQPHLPAYVARFDVGLVPFVVDAATHAASPLKVYEYLAAGVPVAAPPLASLAGLAGVAADADLVAAVAAARSGPPPDAAAARAAHSWDARVAALLAATGLSAPEPAGPDARVVVRPVIHYPPRRRLVGRA